MHTCEKINAFDSKCLADFHNAHVKMESSGKSNECSFSQRFFLLRTLSFISDHGVTSAMLLTALNLCTVLYLIIAYLPYESQFVPTSLLQTAFPQRSTTTSPTSYFFEKR